MENLRIYEEDGYIDFMMRPEDLMRLRYSEEAKTFFPILWTAGSIR